MRIGITIPIYCSNEVKHEFLKGTINSIETQEHNIVFVPVENYMALEFKEQGYNFFPTRGGFPEEITVVAGRQPQSVAKAWNDGVRVCFERRCDYCLILNDDVVLRPDALDHLINFAEAHPEYAIVTMAQFADYTTLRTVKLEPNWGEHPSFSAFMVRPDFQQKLGLFDENFKNAYFEDNDMHARIALSNEKAVVYNGSLFYHWGSRTINSDLELGKEVQVTFNRNSFYFTEKWGSGTVGEVDDMRKLYFQHPYNDPSKPLSYWRQPE